MKRHLSTLLAVAGTIAVVAVGSSVFHAQVTPPQYVLDPGGTGGTVISWEDAEAECVTAGGHLATIESDDDHAEALATIGSARNVWIGLHVEGSEFVWVDGTPLSYTNWDSNQPNSRTNLAAASQKCVFFAHTATNKWHDLACSGDTAVTHYLCQITDKCGDGTKDTDTDPPEECDDGNTTADDGCSAGCKHECGNGTIGVNEDCDGTNLGGLSCASEMGSGYEGTLLCNAECKIDISQCEESDQPSEPKEEDPPQNPPEEQILIEWEEDNILVATACVRPSGNASSAGGGGGGGQGGGGQGGQGETPTAQVATDIHNVNDGAPGITQGPFRQFMAQVGGKDWPRMQMKIELVDAPQGRVAMGTLKNAKVYKDGSNPDDPGVRETIPPVVSADGKVITWTTQSPVPFGYDFATWISVDAYDAGGEAVITYYPASEANNQASGLFTGQVTTQKEGTHQRKVLDLRSPLCEDFAVDKQEACPGDSLLYIGAFADPSAVSVTPTIPLHNCLDRQKIMAIEPDSCEFSGTTVRCSPLSFSQEWLSLVSFVAPVTKDCPAGTKITMFANAKYAPSGETKKTTSVVTTVKDCGQPKVSSSQSSSSSSSRTSSSRTSSSSLSRTSAGNISFSSSFSPGSSSRTSGMSHSSSITVAFSSPRTSSSVFSTPPSSSRQSSVSINSLAQSSPASCHPDPCGAGGGGVYCSEQGKVCNELAGPPCIICVDVPLTLRSSLSSRSSQQALLCGNGAVEPGEECDDRNRRDFDGCSSDCLIESGYCGDGVVERLLGEQCEPSVTGDNDILRCGSDCRFILSSCGNGVTDLGEECDGGQSNSDLQNAECRSYCIRARCGDGIFDDLRNEECDDGNNAGGDGCSSSCAVERPATGILDDAVFEFPVLPENVLPANVIAQMPVHSPVGSTGPASVAIMAGGAAAGIGWMRRKRKK